MQSAIAQAMLRVAEQQRLQEKTMCDRALEQDARQTHIVTYAGYRDGRHWGRVIDSIGGSSHGLIPFTPASNGAIETNQVFQVQVQRTNRIGYWMPRG